MDGLFYWLLKQAIAIQVVISVILVLGGIGGWVNGIFIRSRLIKRVYLAAVSVAILTGILIAASAGLSMFKIEYHDDQHEGRWSHAVLSIGASDKYIYLTSPDCRDASPKKDGTDEGMLLALSFSIHCDPHQKVALESIDDPDSFVRYASIRRLLHAAPSRKKTTSPLRGRNEVEMINRSLASIVDGSFPSEMSYNREGGLSRHFRQYLRDRGLVSQSILSTGDMALSMQLVVKEIARIGSGVWFDMTETPRVIDGGPGKVSF